MNRNKWNPSSWQGGLNNREMWVTCANCGYSLHYFSAPQAFQKLQHAKDVHEADCWQKEQQCEVIDPFAPGSRCILVKGHPVGEKYNWFTDWEGHMFEKPPEPVQEAF